jgi:hypothetical protein
MSLSLAHKLQCSAFRIAILLFFCYLLEPQIQINYNPITACFFSNQLNSLNNRIQKSRFLFK